MTVPGLKKIKPKKSSKIVIHIELCSGCGICELACSLYNEDRCSPSLSRIKVYRNFLDLTFKPAVCIQCEWPSCYFECPVGAIKINSKNGVRYIDPAECTGCGRCAEVCPLMPELEIVGWKEIEKKKVFYKCDLCRNRDEGPLCVQMCPRNALEFIE